MLILPFNTLPQFHPPFFNKLEIKTAAHAGLFYKRNDKSRHCEEKRVRGVTSSNSYIKAEGMKNELEVNEMLFPAFPAQNVHFTISLLLVTASSLYNARLL